MARPRPASPLRRRTVADALAALSSVNRRAARPVAKAIASAFANAKQRNPELREDQVVITKLTADELRTLFADNTDLVEGLFRTIVSRWSDDERRVVTRGEDTGTTPLPTDGALSPIDTVLALRHVGIFSRVGAEEMLQLASIARQTPLEAGTTLAAAGNPPGLWVILSGELSLESAAGGRAVGAAAGDAVGLVGTLAGASLDWSVHVERRGSALRIERDDLFDLLGQRPALLQQLFSALFRH